MLGGFHFRETMSGTWTRAGDPGAERPISFTITARAKSLLQHLRDHDTELEGRLRMDGFADDVTVHGRLHINPLLGRVIKYEFDFTADDGQRYRFRGQKDVSITDIVGTMTRLPATIEDASGKLIANANLEFDKRDLGSFLASFRPGR